MVLSTHAVCGGFLARLIAIDPLSAFIVGFASHYLLDIFPNWSYKLQSGRERVDSKGEKEKDMVFGKDFIVDIGKIIFDLCLGLFLVIYFLQGFGGQYFYLVLFGALGGVVPDLLQFFYFKTRKQPFLFFQKIHDLFHNEKNLSNKPVLGISIQALLQTLMIFFGIFF